MAEYVSVLLCKYTVGPDGAAAYMHTRGRRVNERLCDFGEQMLFDAPGKQRANQDMRWAPGTYLGTCLNRNELWIGLPNGNVTRARSGCKLREDRRWSLDAIQKLAGTPMHPNPLDENDVDEVEGPFRPQAGKDNDLREGFEHEGPQQLARAEGRMRITRADPRNMDSPPTAPLPGNRRGRPPEQQKAH